MQHVTPSGLIYNIAKETLYMSVSFARKWCENIRIVYVYVAIWKYAMFKSLVTYNQDRFVISWFIQWRRTFQTTNEYNVISTFPYIKITFLNCLWDFGAHFLYTVNFAFVVLYVGGATLFFYSKSGPEHNIFTTMKHVMLQ